MKQIFKLSVVGLLFSLLTGCMTYSGNKLSVLNSIEPTISPYIEESVGDFTFDLDGVQMVTDNKMGRLINEAILGKWKDKKYISDYKYVKKENFSGNAQYNLTLKGHQQGDSSVFMQIISGATMLLIPHSIDTSFDLIYELKEVKTGKTYTVEVSESTSTISWLLFLPAMPFASSGADATFEHIAEHTYQGFVKQGAFSTE